MFIVVMVGYFVGACGFCGGLVYFGYKHPKSADMLDRLFHPLRQFRP